MPTYQYECNGCSHSFEILQTMLEKRLRKCPKCGRLKLQRLIGGGSGIIFKGTGFYETDYKKKSAPAEAESSKAGASTKEKKTTAAKTNTEKKKE